MRLKQVVNHYLRKQFLFDFLVWLFFFISINYRVKYMSVVILLKSPRISQIPNKLIEQFNLKIWQQGVYDLIKLIMVILFFAHWFGCGFLFLHYIEKSQGEMNTWVAYYQFDPDNYFLL